MRKKILKNKTLVIVTLFVATLFIGTSLSTVIAGPAISREERKKQIKEEEEQSSNEDTSGITNNNNEVQSKSNDIKTAEAKNEVTKDNIVKSTIKEEVSKTAEIKNEETFPNEITEPEEECKLCEELKNNLESAESTENELSESELNELSEIIDATPDMLTAISEMTSEQQELAREDLIELIDSKEIKDTELKSEIQSIKQKINEMDFSSLKSSESMPKTYADPGMMIPAPVIEEICGMPSIAGIACLLGNIGEDLFSGGAGTVGALLELGLTWEALSFLLGMTTNPFFWALTLYGSYQYLKARYC